MPGGIPVGTLSIGESGAINAALLSAAIIALSDKSVEQALNKWRTNQTDQVTISPINSSNNLE